MAWSHLEAWKRWWLQPWELELYELSGVDAEERAARYLSFHAWNRVVRPGLNDQAWLPLTENKLIFASHYREWGVRVPNTLGFLAPENGRALSGHALRSVADLGVWALETEIRSFVMKPVGGETGAGVFIVQDVQRDASEFVFHLVDGRSLKSDEMDKGLEMSFGDVSGYVVQERYQQHESLQSLSGAPSNNVRVVTLRPLSGPPHVQAAVIRLGRSHLMADNWSRGGIAASVDTATGATGRATFKPPYGRWVENHPDTGMAIAGFSVPFWPEIVDLAIRAAAATPGLRSIGWDIVIAPDGPVIIEGNANWGLSVMQVHSEGYLGTPISEAWNELGADLPDGTNRWRERHGLKTRVRDYPIKAARLLYPPNAIEKLRWHKRWRNRTSTSIGSGTAASASDSPPTGLPPPS